MKQKFVVKLDDLVSGYCSVKVCVDYEGRLAAERPTTVLQDSIVQEHIARRIRDLLNGKDVE